MEITRAASSVASPSSIEPAEKETQPQTGGNPDNKKTWNPIELQEMVKEVNQMLNPNHTSSKYVLHEKLNDYYIQIIDDKTQEVIRELPSKKFLDMYASMLESAGFYVNRKI